MKRVISKKVLFALSLCLVVVIGAVTAYAYLLNQKGTVDEPDFVFTWGPDRQSIVEGTFRLEIWLTLEGENLTIIIKANDGEYDSADYIGLVFFNNSEYESYGLFASNMTITPTILTEHGFLGFPLYPPELGPQKVTFNSKIGYTFTVQFPWVDQDEKEWNPARMLKKGDNYTGQNSLHVCFYDSASGYVSVEFQFYIPEET